MLAEIFFPKAQFRFIHISNVKLILCSGTYEPEVYVTYTYSEKSFSEQIREQRETVEEGIKQTGVDRFFEDRFVREMNYRIPGELCSLDNNTVYIAPGKKEEKDAVSLAKVQGCDIVIDLWVYPMIVNYRPYYGDPSHPDKGLIYASSVQAGLIATRISDGKVLWSQRTRLLSNTKKSSAPNYEVFPTLAEDAALELIHFYDRQKNIFIEKSNSK